MSKPTSSRLNVIVAQAARKRMWNRDRLRKLVSELDLFSNQPHMKYPQGKHSVQVLGNGLNSLFVEYSTTRLIIKIYCKNSVSSLTERLQRLGYKTSEMRGKDLIEIHTKETTKS